MNDASYVRMSFIGVFSIPRQLIQSDPDTVHQLLSKGIILKAECDYYADSIFYTMYAPGLFREVKEGEMPPVYIVTAILEKDGSITFDAEEMK